MIAGRKAQCAAGESAVAEFATSHEADSRTRVPALAACAPSGRVLTGLLLLIRP
jgi:hypothetical protein